MTIPVDVGKIISMYLVKHRQASTDFFQFVAISGETSNRFGAVNCAKMRLAAGLCRDPLGEL